MMRTNLVWTAAGIAAVASAAGAGTVNVGLAPAADTAAVQLADYSAAFPSTPTGLVRQSGLTAFSSAVSGFDLTFGSIATATAAPTSGNLFVGSGADLNNSGTGNWFNSFPGMATSLANDTVMAFGNSGFSAREVTIGFVPGVAGFIFNFADISDVANTQLVVNWSDGSTSSSDITNNGQQMGFISLLAGANQTIESVTLRQDPTVNDGFLFYGFSTLVVVPLPPAAWAGLAMLGGIAGVRKLRRRG